MQLLIEYVPFFLHTSKKVVPFTYNHVVNRPINLFSQRIYRCRGEREAPAANTRRTVNILQKALAGYEESPDPPSPWP